LRNGRAQARKITWQCNGEGFHEAVTVC
jgi:hypothetical protein